jgi:hypothetical protein
VLDNRLDLSETPVRPLRVTDKIARCEHRIAAVLGYGTDSIFCERQEGR